MSVFVQTAAACWALSVYTCFPGYKNVVLRLRAETLRQNTLPGRRVLHFSQAPKSDTF